MTTAGETWDAVVIGAGPAGSYIAGCLARRGVHTLLLDRAEFPRPKLCGGCLAPSGQAVLERAGLTDALGLSSTPAIERLHLESGPHSARLRIPAYRAVDRTVFDAKLVAAAVDGGARFLDGTIARVLPDAQIRIGSQSDGRADACTVRPAIVVVADGIKGNALRQDQRFAWVTKPRSLVGLGVLVRDLPKHCAQDAITMRHGPSGYIGVAPLSGGHADIAAAISPAWLASNRDGSPLPAFARSLGLELSESDYTTPVMGTHQLSRHRARVEANGRIFVCGDAAGYIEPFTGEGMSWALTAAEQLVPLLANAFHGTYREGMWTDRFGKERRRRGALCKTVGGLLRRPRLTGMLVGLSGTIPPVAAGVSSIIRGIHARQRTQAPMLPTETA